MSRITPHCVCQNTDDNVEAPSKTYSFLPNYFEKSENNPRQPQDKCENYQSNSKDNNFLRPNKCKVCKNYENIEHFLSGSFRPHSCSTEESDVCFMRDPVCNNISLVSENHRQNDSQKRFSNLSTRHNKTKLHDQICLVKNAIKEGAIQKLDSIHPGLDLVINHSTHPLIEDTVNKTKNVSNRRTHNDNDLFMGNTGKKQSCGLKYIIFQKLSIMTHFLMKSKDKSSSVKLDKQRLSDENLFKENQCYTKRSKSFHTIEPKTGRVCDGYCSSHIVTSRDKQQIYKNKESDTFYSSTGSIDAHAGSPITMMSTACNNLIGNIPNTVMTTSLGYNTTARNEWRHKRNSPDVREFSQKKSHHQKKIPQNISQIDSLQMCSTHQNYPCLNCFYPCQQSCHQIVFDQMYRPHCHLQSPIPTQFQQCHCCCFNHSHVVMHQPLPPSLCCHQSNYACQCQTATRSCLLQQQKLYQYENHAKSTLCTSCQSTTNFRCKSESLENHGRCSQQSHLGRSCNLASNNNLRHKLKSENKVRNSKPSQSNHSKSIPPPPPPPPSSLYSANDATTHKSKHRKHCHNKVGKLCESCSIIFPQMIHTSDCTNNVQNIIYSHLNNNVAYNVPKIDQEMATQYPDLPYLREDPAENGQKNIKCRHSRGSVMESCDKEGEPRLCSSKKRGTHYGIQKDVFDRRPTSVMKENLSDYKPRFLSKTPETYKSKNDHRHKKRQYDNHRIYEHKSISTTREYKFMDNDFFYRDDSNDSPEAGSFIYHPMSPLIQKNVQTVAPKKVSSFNSRQHRNYQDLSHRKTELIRKAFQANMLSLREVGWYWGPLSFIEAESLMENKANGTFLVRDSGHDTYFLSLTFRVRETTYHTRIEYSQGTFSFWSQPESHSATTIVEFIDKAVAHSQSGKFHYFLLTNVPGQPPMEVSLLYPLSRHQIVHSLKHLSRFVILSHIRKDHITELAVPPVLRAYLMEKQYYISNLHEFIDTTQDAHPLSYKPSTPV